MDDMKLPLNEASGRKPLHGTYKVSFLVNIDSEDDIHTSDFGLFLTEGFGENLVEKVASLDIEKIYKIAKVELKPGDLVYLNRDISIKATVVKDNSGIYCVGSIGTPVCEEYSLSLQKGLIAEVNKIAEGVAELVGFDNLIEASFIDVETDEPFCENVRLDLIAVDLDVVNKINDNPPETSNTEEVA